MRRIADPASCRVLLGQELSWKDIDNAQRILGSVCYGSLADVQDGLRGLQLLVSPNVRFRLEADVQLLLMQFAVSVIGLLKRRHHIYL